MTRHQYGISAIVHQMCLPGKPVEASQKCRLFSQASTFWAVFAIVQIVNQN